MMTPTPTGARWILSICTALLSTCAIADIPSATNECLADLLETTPSSDFTPLEGGAVVRHEPTGLEWQRCVVGWSWTGNGCSNVSLAYFPDWKQALQQADRFPGWRLPSIGELRSIVERCKSSPAVNLQVFPDTGNVFFWSASPFVGDSASSVWGVDFGSGSASWALKSGTLNLRSVRLVRDGQ